MLYTRFADMETESDRNWLLAVLNDKAVLSPSKCAISWYTNTNFKECSLTYSGLEEQSDYISNYLLRSGVSPGEIVLVILPPGPNVAAALFGCLKASAIFGMGNIFCCK
jgi:acyl-CoA synthetase (AMP-forming)/AMP-acid ligase II